MINTVDESDKNNNNFGMNYTTKRAYKVLSQNKKLERQFMMLQDLGQK